MPDEPVRPRPPATPLLDRLKVIEAQAGEQVTFLKWLDATGRLLPGGRTEVEIIAAYLGINLTQVADERKQLIDYAEAMKSYWRQKDAADAARGKL